MKQKRVQSSYGRTGGTSNSLFKGSSSSQKIGMKPSSSTGLRNKSSVPSGKPPNDNRRKALQDKGPS